uniref:Uncharacterized protein n=1 Tax=Candidatus Kentrum sp. DK TaxID=2126562 RepID=A0A450SKW4_9GAMM|nr:MAG: hypothetical protein BECKDK2373C_GA0170839_104224 [Candidatus Kentron sp. DK]
MSRKYGREDWSGNKYWEDEDGNREYEREDRAGNKYREDSDGSREYEREDWAGNKYREDSAGNRTYIREDGDGNTYEEEKGGGGCFLTTACVKHAGLPDDCYELETLRRFRDNYIMKRADGNTLLHEYYSNGPKIVASLLSSRTHEFELKGVYLEIERSVRLIESGSNEEALRCYRKMYDGLYRKYCAKKARSA